MPTNACKLFVPRHKVHLLVFFVLDKAPLVCCVVVCFEEYCLVILTVQ
jgi:hypothetical protein